MLPANAYACLQKLAAMARYGSTPNEVARYLILRGLDDLTRSGVQSWPQESEQDDKWSFCLTAGMLCPANQERQ